MFFQVIIEHERIFVNDARLPDEPGQCAHAPVIEHHVAVAMGIGHAPFVGEHGDEPRRLCIKIGGFLDQPPGVLLAAAVVVVAVADPVERRGINRIAPHVFKRAVGAAVRGDLGMPVELAAQQAVILAAGLDAIGLDTLQVAGFVGVNVGRRPWPPFPVPA